MPPKEKSRKKEKGEGGNGKDKNKQGSSKKNQNKAKDNASVKGSKGGESDKKKNKKKGKSSEEGSGKGKKSSGKGKKSKPSSAKKEKESESEGAEVEELLAAPPDLGLLGNLLERFCCCRSAAKVAFEEQQREERERRAAEEQEQKDKEEHEARERGVARGDIPLKELRKHIREFTKNYEADFWPPFMQSEVQRRLQFAAATRIQTAVRRFVAPACRRRHLQAAYQSCDQFWEQRRAQRMHAKDLLAIAASTRASFAARFAASHFRAAVSAKARRDAASLLSRAWRGYVGRRIFRYFLELARELRERKPRKPKSRFGAETFQRVWARKWAPARGYRGRADTAEFDMWEHKNKPPKGNDYGLLTRKIHAAPRSEKELRLLMADKNAWVGIPIAVVSQREARKEEPDRVQAFKATTPYSTRLVSKEQTRPAPRRPSGLQTLLSLGWRSPLSSQQGPVAGRRRKKDPEREQKEERVANRHRAPQEQRQIVLPRQAAVTRVMRVPADGSAYRTESSVIDPGSVDLNSGVFQQAADFVPFHPGARSGSLLMDESFVNTELNNMSSHEQSAGGASFLGESHAFNTHSSASGGRAEKRKPTGERLSTLRSDEVPAAERGARKAPQGRPLRVGAATEELAGGAGVAAVGREQERRLMNLGLGLEEGALSQAGGVKSVSFLTAPGEEATGGERLSRTSSQLPAGTSEGSAWQRLRDEVSTLTGSKKRFLRGVTDLAPSSSGTVRAEQRRSTLENRQRPWPVKKKPHLVLRYSWLSQGMLQRAAEEVHADDPEVERERARARAEEERLERERWQRPPLSRLAQYNDDDPTVISSLGGLRSFQNKTALSIRDERCRAQAMQHPYHWL